MTGLNITIDTADQLLSDSLAVLIAIHNVASASGGQLHLRNPDARLRRMLSITGLDNVLVVPDHQSSLRGATART